MGTVLCSMQVDLLLFLESIPLLHDQPSYLHSKPEEQVERERYVSLIIIEEILGSWNVLGGITLTVHPFMKIPALTHPFMRGCVLHLYVSCE